MAPPVCKLNSRTTSPTSTASSTRAVMSRGVDTATSTPHASSNNHSFLGLFTRPTVRGTPNSLRARSETTRLALSSPVAATTTSASSVLARCSTSRSHASPTTHWVPRRFDRPITSDVASITTISWPWDTSSRAIEDPTDPPPTTMTLMTAPVRARVLRWRPGPLLP